MNSLNKIICLLILGLMVACEDPGTTNNGRPSPTDYEPNTATPIAPANTDTDTSSAATTGESMTSAIPDQKDCTIADKHYDKNVFVAKDLARQISIVANESTLDKDLGDSHRILRVVNTTDCSIISEQTLPINRSPDFPYYLIPNTYDSQNQIMAIQGFSSTHYYDIKNEKLIGPVVPQFLKNRDAVDAQSGMVKGLSVWGHYLLGYAVDYGTFAFDIADVNNPKPLLPVAEYTIPKTTEFNNLFLLDAGNGQYQAILPTTDFDAGGNLFDLDSMFPQPLKVNTTVAKNVQNNRFIILNDSTIPGQQRKVVIDMHSKKWIDLPDAMATKKAGEILTWLEGNQ